MTYFRFLEFCKFLFFCGGCVFLFNFFCYTCIPRTTEMSCCRYVAYVTISEKMCVSFELFSTWNLRLPFSSNTFTLNTICASNVEFNLSLFHVLLQITENNTLPRPSNMNPFDMNFSRSSTTASQNANSNTPQFQYQSANTNQQQPVNSINYGQNAVGTPSARHTYAGNGSGGFQGLPTQQTQSVTQSAVLNRDMSQNMTQNQNVIQNIDQNNYQNNQNMSDSRHLIQEAQTLHSQLQNQPFNTKLPNSKLQNVPNRNSMISSNSQPVGCPLDIQE